MNSYFHRLSCSTGQKRVRTLSELKPLHSRIIKVPIKLFFQLILNRVCSQQNMKGTLFPQMVGLPSESRFFRKTLWSLFPEFSKQRKRENLQVFSYKFPYFSISILAYWNLLIDEWGLYQAWQESLCFWFSLKCICRAAQNWIASLGLNQRHGTDLRHSEGNEWLMQFIDRLALLLSHVLFVCNLQWFKFRWI